VVVMVGGGGQSVSQSVTGSYWLYKDMHVHAHIPLSRTHPRSQPASKPAGRQDKGEKRCHSLSRTHPRRTTSQGRKKRYVHLPPRRREPGINPAAWERRMQTVVSRTWDEPSSHRITFAKRDMTWQDKLYMCFPSYMHPCMYASLHPSIHPPTETHEGHGPSFTPARTHAPLLAPLEHVRGDPHRLVRPLEVPVDAFVRM